MIDVAVDLTITVADLAVIALLKMSAYIDRPFDRRHDLEDLGFLLDTYLTDDDERRYADEIVVRQLDFDRAAAFALGRDLASFASAHERALVNRFLDCARTNQHATLTLFAAGATSSRWRNDEDAASALLEDFRLGFDAGE